MTGRQAGMADPVRTTLVGEETASVSGQAHSSHGDVLALPAMLRHPLGEFLLGGRLIPRLTDHAKLGGEVLFDTSATTGVHAGLDLAGSGSVGMQPRHFQRRPWPVGKN